MGSLFTDGLGHGHVPQVVDVEALEELAFWGGELLDHGSGGVRVQPAEAWLGGLPLSHYLGVLGEMDMRS